MSNHKTAKYTDDVLKKIRDMHESGMTPTEIGLSLNKSRDTIAKVMKRYGIHDPAIPMHGLPLLQGNDIEWRDIPGYEGHYKASNTGIIVRVKHVRGGGKIGRPMGYKNSAGYIVVELSTKPGARVHYFSHRLIMLTFKGERPEGMDVNHINGIKHDNRVENLEYVTRSENILHAYHILKCHNTARGSRSGTAKLTEEIVLEIRKLRETGLNFTEIGKLYQVSRGAIRSAINGKTWTHVE